MVEILESGWFSGLGLEWNVGAWWSFVKILDEEVYFGIIMEYW